MFGVLKFKISKGYCLTRVDWAFKNQEIQKQISPCIVANDVLFGANSQYASGLKNKISSSLTDSTLL